MNGTACEVVVRSKWLWKLEITLALAFAAQSGETHSPDAAPPATKGS